MSGSSRSGRWLVAGAVALVLMGVGGVLRLSAANSDGSTVFVPITPCRLMDTRAGAQVGPRGTPIGAAETYSPLVRGSNGNCTIPATATSVSLNVTFVGPTSDGFVTVFPPDQPRPTTSNLNFSAGQAPAPNAVTSPLSFDGKIGFYNDRGTVNLIADVVGYYEELDLPDLPPPAPGSEGLVSGRCAAILRWDLPQCEKATYATGDGPFTGVAFDGTSIWVANQDADTVSKINPDTGAKVDFPVGDAPQGVVFDGTSIWVTNSGVDTVSKVNPITGAVIATYATGDAPQGIAFDGTSIWIANLFSGTVSKMNPATGTKTDVTTGSGATAVAFDGTNIWVANSGANTVSKVNPTTATETSEFATGVGPVGIAFDGTRLWISNFAADSVSIMNPATGAKTDLGVGDGPRGVAFDGIHVWVADSGDDSVHKFDAVSGTVVALYATGDGPSGVAFDGSNIWITNINGDTVSKMVP